MTQEEKQHAVERGNPGTSRIPHIRSAWERGLAALEPTPAQLEHGLELHRQSMVVDTFGFLPLVYNERLKEEWHGLIEAGVTGNDFHFRSGMYRRASPTYDRASGEELLEAIRCSGITGIVHTSAEGKSREEDIKRIATSVHTCGWFGHSLRQLRQPEDLEEAHRLGSVAVALSVNGPPCPGHLIELADEISWLTAWRQLGVRLMHLSYNRRNMIATGCAERNDGGLSELGYDFVRAMNRAGLIVDVPHSSENTGLQAAEASEKPIMASHTGCRAVYDHIRNKSDRVLKAVAGTGGLVGIVTLGSFLGPKANVQTLLDHIDHAVKTIGPDHVAIGTDTCYSPPFPEDWTRPPKSEFSAQWWGAWDQEKHKLHASDEHSLGSLAWTNWPLFTIGMVTRGYSDDDIRKILGQNLLRVLRDNHPEETAPSDVPVAPVSG